MSYIVAYCTTFLKGGIIQFVMDMVCVVVRNSLIGYQDIVPNISGCLVGLVIIAY